jgi:hypothetical protein
MEKKDMIYNEQDFEKEVGILHDFMHREKDGCPAPHKLFGEDYESVIEAIKTVARESLANDEYNKCHLGVIENRIMKTLPLKYATLYAEQKNKGYIPWNWAHTYNVIRTSVSFIIRHLAEIEFYRYRQGAGA